MFRLLIIGAVLTAFASPTVRAWVRPHLDSVLDPTYEWSVRSRVSEIARKIAADRAGGRSVPTVGPIPDYVRHHYRQEGSGLDPWGIPFHLVNTSEGLRVASAGPDRAIHTDDDVLSPPISSARH